MPVVAWAPAAATGVVAAINGGQLELLMLFSWQEDSAAAVSAGGVTCCTADADAGGTVVVPAVECCRLVVRVAGAAGFVGCAETLPAATSS